MIPPTPPPTLELEFTPLVLPFFLTRTLRRVREEGLPPGSRDEEVTNEVKRKHVALLRHRVEGQMESPPCHSALPSFSSH